MSILPSGDIAIAITQDAASTTHSIVMRTTPTGDIIWATSLAADVTLELASISATSDGGILTGAKKIDTAAGLWILSVTKLDGNGILLWTKEI